MKTKKRNNRKRRPRPQWLNWALPAAAAAGLLAIILLLGRHTSAPTTEPKSTLPPLEANPYRAEDFQYKDGLLTCTVADTMFGIDVSEHQQTVDWTQVRQAGVEFAMVRVGYRGYTHGQLYEDEYAATNLAGASTAGLKVGAYFFSQAVTVDEAREEAAFLLDILDGMEIQMPVVFDWEYVSQDARTGTADSRTITDCAIAFCKTVKAAGYEPMVYFNQDLGENLFLLQELTDYDFWLAMYSTEMDYPYRVDMWQYTDCGSIPGIEGNVDLNLYLP